MHAIKWDAEHAEVVRSRCQSSACSRQPSVVVSRFNHKGHEEGHKDHKGRPVHNREGGIGRNPLFLQENQRSGHAGDKTAAKVDKPFQLTGVHTHRPCGGDIIACDGQSPSGFSPCLSEPGEIETLHIRR